MGESLAGVHTTRLKNQFPNLNALVMAGIAGGVPNPGKPSDHVRLGDIVVSDKYGVVQFDYGKQTSHNYEYRAAPRPPLARLLDAARHLRTREIEGQRPWEVHLEHALAALGWVRPLGENDFLGDSADHKKRVEHPKEPARVEGHPRVFFGLIASSNTLLKDPVKRDEIRNTFGAKAIEMETAGLADAAWVLEVGYLGVRGICDYCDENKNDEWQSYAALAAAAYVRALLESIPGSIPALPPEADPASSDRSRRETPEPSGLQSDVALSIESDTLASLLVPETTSTANPPSGTAASASPASRGEGGPSSGTHVPGWWEAYRSRTRLSVRKSIESLDGIQGSGETMLARMASELNISDSTWERPRWKDAITTQLLAWLDDDVLASLIRFHGDLTKESSRQAAEVVKAIVHLILPFYLSWEGIDKARQDLRGRQVVLIEGVVATPVGAEIRMAAFDEQSTAFKPDVSGRPRGKHSYPLKQDVIGAPSLDSRVLSVLQELVSSVGLDLHDAQDFAELADDNARVQAYAKLISSRFRPHKQLHRRSPYCAVRKPGTTVERQNLLMILGRIAKLIPELIFIELDPKSASHEREVTIEACLNFMFSPEG